VYDNIAVHMGRGKYPILCGPLDFDIPTAAASIVGT